HLKTKFFHYTTLFRSKENINKIYCAIRPRKNTTPKKRLLNKIKFYFGDKYNELFDKYIEIVECEIEKEQFNLNYSTYKKIQDNVDRKSTRLNSSHVSI